MPDLTIKPNVGAGNKVIIQDQSETAVFTTGDSGITSIKLAATATASAPSGAAGALYYDSDKNALMHYVGSAWVRVGLAADPKACLLYTSPSPRDGLLSRMPSSA